MLAADTPLETYTVGGVPVFVKREDLCWPFPPISKARGVYAAIANRPDIQTVAVVDTGKSVNGLLVSTIGLFFKRQIIVGYPRYVANPGAIPGPTNAIVSLLGSGNIELVPIQANRQFVMLAEMKKHLERCEQNPWFCFPTGLRLPETVEATSRIAASVIREINPKTFVVPTGTGTHLAGILRAFSGSVIGVQGYGRPETTFRRDVWRMAGLPPDDKRLHVVTSLHGYYEARPDLLPPWPANAHYEVKAYKWLRGAAPNLQQPIVFWNIGS